jgi:hypothetical protein
MQEILLTVGIIAVLYFLLFDKGKNSIETTTINYQISTS